MSGIVCALDVRIAYVDPDGVPTGGHVGILNPVKLTVGTPEPDRQQRISHLRDSFGQALDEITTPKPTEVEFSTDDTGDAEVMAWALNGEAVGFTQSTATIVDEAFVATKGQWGRLANRSVTDVVVKDTTGTTTYTLNTDYLVDPISGYIKITDGGAIADADPLKISYAAAALTGKLIKAGTNPNIFVQIEGEGKNIANGRPVHVSIPRASLSANGALDLVGSDFLVTELKGTALKVPGREVAEVLYLDAA